uniref:Uncharacterized protein n=1 Tax=Oryza nivara TaxID=4536 RepID=A0A0E0I606_ORYNI
MELCVQAVDWTRHSRPAGDEEVEHNSKEEVSMAYFSRLPAGCPCRGQLLTMDHRLEENASGGEVAPELALLGAGQVACAYQDPLAVGGRFHMSTKLRWYMGCASLWAALAMKQRQRHAGCRDLPAELAAKLMQALKRNWAER